MNFFSAFQVEVFRPIVTLLIPGAIAISSWVVALFLQFPALKELAERNQTQATWVLLAVMTGVGFFIENRGASMEVRWDKEADGADPRNPGAHTKKWYEYLRTAFIAEPCGRRYYRNVTLRFKFELGMIAAPICSAAGVIWLLFLGLHCISAIVLITLAVSIAVFEYYDARDTHTLLAQIRSELLGEIRFVVAPATHATDAKPPAVP